MAKAGSRKTKVSKVEVPCIRQLCVLRLVNVTIPKNVFQDDKRSKIQFHELEGVDGLLAVGPNLPKDPPWLEFIRSGTSAPVNLRNLSSSAVIIVQVGGDTLAYCFGYGRYLLDDAYIDGSFGLRLAFNILDPDKIRSLDSKRLDNYQFSRHQTHEGRNVVQFGFDVESDLLHAVMGIPKTNALCKAIAGRDAAILNCSLEIKDLAKKSKEILKAFKETSYRTHFEWLDNIKKIKDRSFIGKLDKELINRMNAKPTEVTLVEKEIHDWYTTGMFRYSISPTKFPMLNLQDLL